MIKFAQLMSNLRSRFEIWMKVNQPKIGTFAGVGITAWAVGALLGQLSAEAQTVGWTAILATLSAELGKDFVVGLVERIRDKDLNSDDISAIVQLELDQKLPLVDLQKIIGEVSLLPTILEEILHQNNMFLLTALQSDLAAYPQIISGHTLQQIQTIVIPKFSELNNRLDVLDDVSQQTLRILTSLAATPILSLIPGSEPALLVFISSRTEELGQERQTLRHTLTKLGLTNPWVFESTTASSQLVTQTHLDKIQKCDFFILLIDEHVSASMERECEEAVKFDRPVLAFLKQDISSTDQHRSLETRALIERIPTKWTTFSDLTDLSLQLRMSICDEVIRSVRNGALVLAEHNLHNIEQIGRSLASVRSNLPSRRYTRLIGRSDDLNILLDKVLSTNSTDQSIVAITGLGGIGKTALAYELAERAMLEKRFDGLIWESAKSEELESNKILQINSSILTPETLMRAIALQLGNEKLINLPPGEREKQIRHLMQNGSYLIIVDNLETIDYYQDLAKFLNSLISPNLSDRPSRGLLTSRERLFEIPYLYDHYIHGLSRLDSFEFIKQEAITRRAPSLTTMTDELMDQIFLITHGMPLAMKLIVSQFLAGIPVDTELDRLETAREDKLYEFIYLRSWLKLSVPAKKILIATASFASSVTRLLIQPVSRITDDEFEKAIPELVRLSLVETNDSLTVADQRFSIHALTRWFINSPLRNRWQRSRNM